MQPSGLSQRDATAQARQLVAAGLQQLSLPPTDPQFARLAEMKRQLRVHSPDGAAGDATPAAGKILRSFERSSEYSFQAQLPLTLAQEGAAAPRNLLAGGDAPHKHGNSSLCAGWQLCAVSCISLRLLPRRSLPAASCTPSIACNADARLVRNDCATPAASSLATTIRYARTSGRTCRAGLAGAPGAPQAQQRRIQARKHGCYGLAPPCPGAEADRACA